MFIRTCVLCTLLAFTSGASAELDLNEFKMMIKELNSASDEAHRQNLKNLLHSYFAGSRAMYQNHIADKMRGIRDTEVRQQLAREAIRCLGLSVEVLLENAQTELRTRPLPGSTPLAGWMFFHLNERCENVIFAIEAASE